MAIYDFRCMKCDQIDENISMPISHQREDLPWHCGQRMSYHISKAPSVHWIDPVIEPFRNPAAPRDTKDSVILTSSQRRAFMEKNDLIDANDLVKPTHEEQAETHKEVMRTIDEITPTKDQEAQMKHDGLMAPSE